MPWPTLRATVLLAITIPSQLMSNQMPLAELSVISESRTAAVVVEVTLIAAMAAKAAGAVGEAREAVGTIRLDAVESVVEEHAVRHGHGRRKDAQASTSAPGHRDAVEEH